MFTGDYLRWLMEDLPRVVRQVEDHHHQGGTVDIHRWFSVLASGGLSSSCSILEDYRQVNRLLDFR